MRQWLREALVGAAIGAIAGVALGAFVGVVVTYRVNTIIAPTIEHTEQMIDEIEKTIETLEGR